MNQETETTGKVRWDPENLDVGISLVANAHGLGYGQAILKNIKYASDKPVSLYGGGNKKIGIMEVWDGSGGEKSTPQTETVSVTYTRRIPEEAGDDYEWSADGIVNLDEWAWIPRGGFAHTTAGGITITTTGTYKKVGNTIPRSTSGGGGWEVVHSYECVDCLTPAESLAALSPYHDKVTCIAFGCGEEFRNCMSAQVAHTHTHIMHTICNKPIWYCLPSSVAEHQMMITCTVDVERGFFNRNEDCGERYHACDPDGCHNKDNHVIPCLGGCGEELSPERALTLHRRDCTTASGDAGDIYAGTHTYYNCTKAGRDAHYRGFGSCGHYYRVCVPGNHPNNCLTSSGSQ